MSTEIKPKRWTVQMLKDAVEVNLESHQFRLLSLEARQQVLDHSNFPSKLRMSDTTTL